jgi:putative oxidoreductase
MNATRYVPFAGRLLIGLPFAMSGLSKLGAYATTTAYIGAVGLPLPPLAYAVAVAVELGGGLLLIAGFRARSVALALALFSLATAFAFHNNFADQNQMIHFLIAIVGGLLYVGVLGAAKFSLDRRSTRCRHSGFHALRRTRALGDPLALSVVRMRLAEFSRVAFARISATRNQSCPTHGRGWCM